MGSRGINKEGVNRLRSPAIDAHLLTHRAVWQHRAHLHVLGTLLHRDRLRLFGHVKFLQGSPIGQKIGDFGHSETVHGHLLTHHFDRKHRSHLDVSGIAGVHSGDADVHRGGSSSGEEVLNIASFEAVNNHLLTHHHLREHFQHGDVLRQAVCIHPWGEDQALQVGTKVRSEKCINGRRVDAICQHSLSDRAFREKLLHLGVLRRALAGSMGSRKESLRHGTSRARGRFRG
mmetsp:Transcript_41816/g.72592  ORF Transcript_41816/g.72592 Transcript_41816/m.72592 type:complete len:231 (-) Transcript_41816:682-1374(-)